MRNIEERVASIIEQVIRRTPGETEFHQAVREVAEAAGVKLGAVAQPMRAALTGRRTSPGIFDVLVLLGREESLGRIADQMTG